MSNQQSELTLKEALAVVYKLEAAVGRHLVAEKATEEEKALGDQIYAALNVLKMHIHGAPALDATLALCEICYLRYIPLKSPFVFLKGDSDTHKSLCTECLEHLKAQGEIERLEHWETGEGLPCSL